MGLNKQQWEELKAVREMGLCNMLDKACIQKQIGFNLTNELHQDYITNFKNIV